MIGTPIKGPSGPPTNYYWHRAAAEAKTKEDSKAEKTDK